MITLLGELDIILLSLVSQADLLTSLLAVLIGLVVTYSLTWSRQPDVHPMILGRQSYVGRVRNINESPIYHSLDAPGGRMRTGLGIRLAQDRPYAPARDGDLRHIWLVVTGQAVFPTAATRLVQNKPAGTKQTIFTISGLGAVRHVPDDVTREISAVGCYLRKCGSNRVAVYLPNSVELLATVFACAFYGLTVVLLPFDQPGQVIVEMLMHAGVDAIVSAAGSVPLEDITIACQSVKQIVWVVEKSSRHMDWTEVPQGTGSAVDVSLWHELVADRHHDFHLPGLDDFTPGDIVLFWIRDPMSSFDCMTFTHCHFVAAISALVHALPSPQRLGLDDVFLPAEGLTTSHCLAHTMAALLSGASLAISSVAGPNADLSFAGTAIKATVVLASPESLEKLHSQLKPQVSSGFAKLLHASKLRMLSDGLMPAPSSGTPATSFLGSAPGILRLIHVIEKAGGTNPPLIPSELNDLRVFTGARIVYALAAPYVAGVVAQTHVYDYRDQGDCRQRHFGGPVGCIELKILGDEVGDILIRGPSVVGDQRTLQKIGSMGADCTLRYV